MPDQCQLPQLAFCDTFQTDRPGAAPATSTRRNGPCGASHASEQPAPGLVNNYEPFNAEFCMDTTPAAILTTTASSAAAVR